MSIEGVLVFYRTTEYANSWDGGGGLNCEAKAQVLIVTPPPLFFLKVGRKRGGRNSGAVRYMFLWTSQLPFSKSQNLGSTHPCNHCSVVLLSSKNESFLPSELIVSPGCECEKRLIYEEYAVQTRILSPSIYGLYGVFLTVYAARSKSYQPNIAHSSVYKLLQHSQ